MTEFIKYHYDKYEQLKWITWRGKKTKPHLREADFTFAVTTRPQSLFTSLYST